MGVSAVREKWNIERARMAIIVRQHPAYLQHADVFSNMVELIHGFASPPNQ
ncbi:hypothetical protein N9053_01880 [bacterium]|nr:hypothetical protein [bacterium]